MFEAGGRPRAAFLLVGDAGADDWRRAFWFGSSARSPQRTRDYHDADTVFLADGSQALGNLIITWPAFLTTSGVAVAGGATTTTLGANGALSVALVPSTGATPAAVYYTVVYQLGPGQVRTEFWVVPTTSPANLATVRTTPGSSVAEQAISLQYVNSGLATKANVSAVVPLSGTETISGAKTFAAAPSVPSPTGTGQVASKAYVDQAFSNVGGGVFLPTAGGTMTGPITLPANPTSGLQAATYSSCTFHLKFNGTVIEGNANEMWQGASVFLFAARVTGFQIDPSCKGCALRDIEEIGGGKPWPNGGAACYNSGNALVYPFTGAADGDPGLWRRADD